MKIKVIKVLIHNSKKFLSKYGIWLIFLIFLLATFPFLYEKSFDNQEIEYLKISQWNIKKIIFENWGDQLPFWFILAKIYIAFFGNSEISLKILSVGMFLLSAFVLYKICEIYNLNKYLITALFLFNPLLLKEIAFTFKHWSFLILTILSVIYFFEKFKITKNKKHLFLLFLAIIAGMYSNLIFLIFFYSFIIYVLINFLSKQISFKFFVFFLTACTFFSIPLFYYYERASNQLINVQGSHMDWGTTTRGFDFIKGSLKYIGGMNYLNNSLSAIIIFLIFLFFTIQFFLEKDKKFIYLKTWLVSTVFFILLIMMIMASRTPVSARYYATAIPFLYMAIFPKSKKLYIALIAILILSITIFSSWQMAKNNQFDNWKGVSSFLQPNIKENTQILIIYKFSVGNLLMEYYLKKPVTRLPSIDNDSIFYSDDIWIIKQYGTYDAINKMTNKYDIKEYNNFKPIKLFHLTKKNPKENNSLIFNNPLIEIEKDKKVQKIQFSNGITSAWNFQEDWQQIRIDTKASGGIEKTCLFVHPRDNTKINIIYKDIKLSQTIKVLTSIADDMVDKNLSPVYVDVYINNVLSKKITHPNEWGWLTTKIATDQYRDKLSDIKFTIYADLEEKRHFCFDAEIIDANDYFYQNIKNAEATIENEPCKIYQTNSIWSHNEKKPPFAEAAIFERWDCEEGLVLKNKIWNTVGKSYASSDNEFKEVIWFHPITDEIKTLEYKNINLWVKKITGFYGLNDLAILNKIKATLTFTITANGEKIYEDKFIPTKGWKKFGIPFNKKLENVIFSITTTDNRWNHFFFNAFLEQ